MKAYQVFCADILLTDRAIELFHCVADYDTIRHLSCYDFLERLNAVKMVHSNMLGKTDSSRVSKAGTLHRPRSGSGKGRRKTVRPRKCNSASVKGSCAVVVSAAQRRLDVRRTQIHITVECNSLITRHLYFYHRLWSKRACSMCPIAAWNAALRRTVATSPICPSHAHRFRRSCWWIMSTRNVIPHVRRYLPHCERLHIDRCWCMRRIIMRTMHTTNRWPMKLFATICTIDICTI